VTWQFTLAGLLIGTLVGMTGMGGGSLMTPVLVILFGVNPTVAIGTDIAHGAIFKTVGAVQHRRMGNVRAQLAGWMLLGSAPMSLVGVWLANWLNDRYGDDLESVMGRLLGAALLFGCAGLIAKTFIRAKELEEDEGFTLSARDKVAAFVIGFFGGFIVGLTSVGSGVFFGLTLLVLFPLRAHKVVGTDIFHAAALLYVALAFGQRRPFDRRLAAAGVDPRRASRRPSDAVDSRAAATAASGLRAGTGGPQAHRCARRRDHRRGRPRGGCDRASRLARQAHLDPLPAGPCSRVESATPCGATPRSSLPSRCSSARRLRSELPSG
jgi:uncharacterized membrane protein YfcA